MFRHFSLRALSAATILLSAATVTAHAQSTATPTPSASPATIVHVTTADRSDHTLKNTARDTYVVTADDIKTEGASTVGEALTTVPGVEISSYGALGAGTNFGIRGSSSAQVLVLVNGLPAPGTFSDSVNLSAFSTVGVKQIEVVEGGGSTLYGTGAIGGIINIITNDQSAPDSASAKYGSFGDREAAATADGFSVQKIVAENLFPVTSTADARYNSDYEYDDLGYGYKAKLGKVDAAFNAGISSDDLGIPNEYGYLSTTSREHDVNLYSQLSFSLHKAQSLTSLEIGGTRQQITDTCEYTPYGSPNPIDPNCYDPLPSLDLDSRVNLALRNAVNGNNEQLLYGIDLARGVSRGDSGNYPQPATTAVPATPTTPAIPAMPAIPQFVDGAIAQTAVYVQDTYSLQGGGHVYAGLRGERDGAFGGALSPSVGFIEPLSSDVSFKVNYATAFRAPNATELYFPDYGNTALQPERAQVGDATIQDRAIAGGADLTWFTNRTNDLIEPVEINATTDQAQNIDHALMQGFTFDIQTKPVHHIYTKFNITDLYEAENLDAQTRLPNDPTIQSNVTLGFLGASTGAFNDAGITEHIEGARAPGPYFTSVAPPYDEPVPYSNLGAFVDLRASQHLMVTLRGYDLGNERYAEIPGYPMPGRSYSIELSTR